MNLSDAVVEVPIENLPPAKLLAGAGKVIATLVLKALIVA